MQSSRAAAQPRAIEVGGRRPGPETADQKERCRSVILKAAADGPEGVSAAWLSSNHLDAKTRPHRDAVLAELVDQGVASSNERRIGSPDVVATTWVDAGWFGLRSVYQEVR